MKKTDFLIYYLTLFTLSSRDSWPLDPHIFFSPLKNDDDIAFASPDWLGQAMSSFSGAQAQRFIEFSAGLKMYFEASLSSQGKNPHVYWEKEGEDVRILKYAPQSDGFPVLIIPSLLTSPSLLDLTSSHSFLNFLVEKGLCPFILDWGSFPGGEHSWTLEDVIAQKLHPAYASLNALKGPPPAVISLWDGIFFALSLANLKRPPSALLFLSEPQGVFQEAPQLQDFFLPLLLPILENYGGIPASFLRFFCSVGHSEKVIQKFISFSKEKEESTKKDLFIAVEDALNQPRFCPAFLAKSYISGDFSPLYPALMDKKLLDIPTLCIQPQGRDLKLRNSLYPFSQLLAPPLGNFGLLTSLFSPLYVWEPLVRWLQKKR